VAISVVWQVFGDQVATQQTHRHLGSEQRGRCEGRKRGLFTLGSHTHGVVIESGTPDSLPQTQQHHEEYHSPRGGRAGQEERRGCGHVAAVLDHREVRPCRRQRGDNRSEPDDHEGVDGVDGASGVLRPEASNEESGQGGVQVSEEGPQVDEEQREQAEAPECGGPDHTAQEACVAVVRCRGF